MERDDSRHCSACDGHGRDDPVAYDCDHVATIAALRDALDGLVADFVDEDPDLPDDYPIEWEMTLGSLRSAALAAAKETP